LTKVARLNGISNSKEFVDIIKDKELLIYEDVQGSRVFVKWTGDNFIIKPKSLNNAPLNLIDLTSQKFYNDAIKHLYSLNNYVTDLLNVSWWFCFEYFPDNQPANVTYNKTPKNNLILNCIVKGSIYNYNLEEIMEYSKLLDVDFLPVLFKGKLTDKQLEAIDLYLSTSEEDLKYLFGECNFAKFFYKLLNPRLENSFLMNSENFNDNLEKIIIKIDGNDLYTFELLNPLYKRLELNNNTEYVQVYSLILVNFLEFCQLISLDTYKLKAVTRDELYIEFVCALFNDYIKNVKDDILNWDFVIPSFFTEEKFKINTYLLKNKQTIENISIDPKMEYIFKVVLGSLGKTKKKPIGVFTEQTLELFNQFVEKLNLLIDSKLNINRNYELQKNDLLNFKDYFHLKYETDAGGAVYPDVFKEFGGEDEGEEKKKGKGKKEGIPEKGLLKPDMKDFSPETERVKKTT
jgi:hypothetical protein